MLAMELIPAIRATLAQLDSGRRDAVCSGRRAALWRAQQHAARIDHTVEDLRRYCLDSLGARHLLDEEDARLPPGVPGGPQRDPQARDPR